MYPRPLMFSLVCTLTVALSACSGGGGGSSSNDSGSENHRPTLELSSAPLSPTGTTGELVEITAYSEDSDKNDTIEITWEIEPDSISINGSSGNGLSISVDDGSSGSADDKNSLTSIRRFHMPETASDLPITITATAVDSAGGESTATLTFTAKPTPETTSAYDFSRSEGWENIPAGKLVEVSTSLLASELGLTVGTIDGEPAYFVPNADNSGYLWVNTGFYQGDHLLSLDDGKGGKINQVFTSTNNAVGAPFQLLELSINLQAAGLLLSQTTPPAVYADLFTALQDQIALAPNLLNPNVASQIGLNLVTLGTDGASVEGHHVSAMLATNFPLAFELFSVPSCTGVVTKLEKVSEILTTYADLERYAEALPALPGILFVEPYGNLKRVIIRSSIGGLVIKNLSMATLGMINSCNHLVVSSIDPSTDDFTPVMAGALTLNSGVTANLYAYGLSGQTQEINDAVVALNAVLMQHSMFNYNQIPENDPLSDSVITSLNVTPSLGAEASCTASVVAGNNLELTCTYTGSGVPADAAPFDLTFTDPTATFSAFVLEDVTFSP